VRDRLAAAAAARHVSLGEAIDQLLAADELRRDYAEHLKAVAQDGSALFTEELGAWEAATGEELPA
jgi:macrodomain Ter protein organizer (MatP/YcbG family)